MKFFACLAICVMLIVASTASVLSPKREKRIVCAGACIAIGTAVAGAAASTVAEKAWDTVSGWFGKRGLSDTLAETAVNVLESAIDKYKDQAFDFLSNGISSLFSKRGLEDARARLDGLIDEINASPNGKMVCEAMLDDWRVIIDRVENDRPAYAKELEDGYNQAKAMIEMKLV